ncbi:hypothetical protein [Methylobacterium sp. WL19]|uniref:hypothetical protein n=1 Tax=Methylobacterium sp. WL19 TaxID=2603896 RepID=UPI0011CAC696|nr:hypothetical protein [Methylobacterium sp. WL19]TXN21356.1 hypothetical protein FV220_23175 [Methylobacterium sp. WL19]
MSRICSQRPSGEPLDLTRAGVGGSSLAHSSADRSVMTGKKLARRTETWGGSGWRRRKVRAHVRKAADKAFLSSTILVVSLLLLPFQFGAMIR